MATTFVPREVPPELRAYWQNAIRQGERYLAEAREQKQPWRIKIHTEQIATAKAILAGR